VTRYFAAALGLVLGVLLGAGVEGADGGLLGAGAGVLLVVVLVDVELPLELLSPEDFDFGWEL
jgi:hypothetical protein